MYYWMMMMTMIIIIIIIIFIFIIIIWIWIWWYTVQLSLRCSATVRSNPDRVVSAQWGDYSLRCLCSLVLNTGSCSVEMIWYGSLFQSTIVLGKNEYLKQSFLVWNCWNVRSLEDRDGRVVGRKILVAGMDRWPCNALWRTRSLLSWRRRDNESHSNLAIISEGWLL